MESKPAIHWQGLTSTVVKERPPLHPFFQLIDIAVEKLFLRLCHSSSHWIKMAYRQIETSMVRKMSGAWHNKNFSLLWRASSNDIVSVVLQLNSSPSCFHLQMLSAKQYLGHTFIQKLQFVVFRVFRALSSSLRRASLRLFVSEIAMAAF